MRDIEVLCGTPVFRGTHVPLQTLLNYLSAGRPLDDFLGAFPAVKREQAVKVLDMLKDRVSTSPH